MASRRRAVRRRRAIAMLVNLLRAAFRANHERREVRPIVAFLRRRERAAQSDWTTVPLCSVTIEALAAHAGTAEVISGQLAIPSCQCLVMPAGDS